MSKLVIGLIRVSTQAQAGDDRGGIPAQREINRRTAKNFDLEIVRTIEIVDVSGALVLASPEMHELLRLIESPDIDGVVTKEFSRLIRPDKFTDLALLETFIETKTILFLPDGPVDLSSKNGRFMGTIRAAFAGLERSEILDRMQDAKEAIRRAGKHPGGQVDSAFWRGLLRREWLVLHRGSRKSKACVRPISLGYVQLRGNSAQAKYSPIELALHFGESDLHGLARLR